MRYTQKQWSPKAKAKKLPSLQTQWVRKAPSTHLETRRNSTCRDYIWQTFFVLAYKQPQHFLVLTKKKSRSLCKIKGEGSKIMNTISFTLALLELLVLSRNF